MQTLCKISLICGLLMACGQGGESNTTAAAPSAAPTAAQATPAPVALAPQAGLISPNLGGCGDADGNSGGLIRVNLGGDSWGCNGRWGGRHR